MVVLSLFHPFQIKLQNPSNKPIIYQAVVAGDGSRDFILPQGNYIQVSTHNFLCAIVKDSCTNFKYFSWKPKNDEMIITWTNVLNALSTFQPRLKINMFLNYNFIITAWKLSRDKVISDPYFPVFGLNTRKCGPEITRYLDSFHAVMIRFL